VRLQVLVVDDNRVSRLVMRHVLAGLGFGTGDAVDVASAVAALSTADYDAVISDLTLPDGSGLDVLAAVSSRVEVPVFVLVTEVDERLRMHEEHPEHVRAILTKPLASSAVAQALGFLER
jgi:CheY-like chemotaxis protein